MAGLQPATRRLLTEAAATALYVPLTQRGVANGVPTLDAGGKIPAGQLPVIPVLLTAVKAADTSRASLIVRAADPELVLPAVPVGVWLVELQAQYVGAASTAGGLKFALEGTAVTAAMGAGLVTAMGPVTGTLGSQSWNPAAEVTAVGGGTNAVGTAPVQARARVRVTTAGTLALAWAQATSNAGSSTLSAGSLLTLTKVA